MKKYIFLVLVMVLALFCGAVQAEEMDYHSDFSAGTDGWYARSGGGAALEVTEEGLLITGRNATWNSPGHAFDLVPQESYRISVEVKQDAIASGRFILSVEHEKDGKVSYENLVSDTLQKGKWVTLSAAWVAGDYDTLDRKSVV